MGLGAAQRADPRSSNGRNLPGALGDTFGHTYSSLLKANGADTKVMQELLRHVSSRVTLNTYTQAFLSHKRKAQSEVVRLVRA